MFWGSLLRSKLFVVLFVAHENCRHKWNARLQTRCVVTMIFFTVVCMPACSYMMFHIANLLVLLQACTNLGVRHLNAHTAQVCFLLVMLSAWCLVLASRVCCLLLACHVWCLVFASRAWCLLLADCSPCLVLACCLLLASRACCLLLGCCSP